MPDSLASILMAWSGYTNPLGEMGLSRLGGACLGVMLFAELSKTAMN